MGLLKPVSVATSGLLAVLLCSLPVRAQTQEYQVKAAILYKFAVFVEWPARAFASPSGPFLACVLGNDPFGPWLQQEMGETRVGAHPVQIHHLEEGEAAGKCHLVFIAASERSRLQKIMTPLRDSGALIISDASDGKEFCRSGGMISLLMEGGKVRFELNVKAMEQAGLKIDSKLKRVVLSTNCGE